MDAHLEIRERIAAEVEAALDRAEGVPARWGVDDCTLFIADILRAATGKDPAEDFRGKYGDKAAAYELIGPRGLAYGIQRRARRYGWQPMSRSRVRLAQYGDLGIYRGPGVQACVLKCGPGFWLGRADYGVAYVRDEKIVAAWSVA